MSEPGRIALRGFGRMTDFELCVGLEKLKAALQTVDANGYDLISVTQSGETYTIFFRRPVNG